MKKVSHSSSPKPGISTSFYSRSRGPSKALASSEELSALEAAFQRPTETFLAVAFLSDAADKVQRDVIRQTWLEWGKRLQVMAAKCT